MRKMRNIKLSICDKSCTDVNVYKCSAHVLYECSVDPQRTVNKFRSSMYTQFLHSPGEAKMM